LHPGAMEKKQRQSNANNVEFVFMIQKFRGSAELMGG